ncbi:ABC transporter permease [uncultured Anaerococcus sp.]|uniref:ABC transporter permease n=1 Tax=uncultured Anaerococcus sp. TaxID=293428 RepID=UPI00288B235B|nr:ABC transporter permease [uncultured Anaerococcus sp.]
MNKISNQSLKSFIGGTIAKSIIVLLIMLIVAAVATPYFFNIYNIQALLRDLAFIGMVSVAQSLVLLTGDIDLSVGSISSLCGVLSALIMTKYNINPYLALVVGIGFGVICGTLNGLIITKLRLNSMVATIGMSGFYSGITLVLTKGKAISNIPEKIQFLGKSNFINIPTPFLIATVVTIICVVVVKKTKFGRYVYAIGNSRESSKIIGIDVDKIRVNLYIVVGAISSLAGILYVARLGSAQSNIGGAWATNSIASSVLGGISLTGGIGNPVGSLLGASIISLIQNLIVLLGVNVYWQSAVSGIVVVLALSFSSISEIIKDRRELNQYVKKEIDKDKESK